MRLSSSLLRMLFPYVSGTLTGLFLLAVSAALWSIQSSVELSEKYFHREGLTVAKGVANAVVIDLIHKDLGALETRLIQAVSDENVRSVLVADLQGRVLSHVDQSADEQQAGPRFGLKRVTPPLHEESMIAETDPGILYIWHRVALGANDIGWVRVGIGADHYSHTVDAMQHKTWALAIIVALAGSILLGIAIWRSYTLLMQHEDNERSSRRKLEDKAYYDSLTHLPNRTLLQDRLEQAVSANKRHGELLAVCFADLDRFKQVNDRFGHHVGDRVLVEAAQRLESAVRGGDTVARLGGDEFVLLLNGLQDEEEAAQAVERLQTALNRPLDLHDGEIAIAGSIGYVLYPLDASDPEKLIELADRSMYRMKSERPGGVMRHSPLHQDATS